MFAARLSPNNSLGPRGVAIVLAGVGLVSFTVSLPFVLLGAWPVGGFFGLDVLALWLAFRAASRRARAYEEVFVTRVDLLLRKVSAQGERSEWRFNPAWVRLGRDEHAEFGVQRLTLRERGRSVSVGGFLGPDEKAEVAAALGEALREARRR